VLKGISDTKEILEDTLICSSSSVPTREVDALSCPHHHSWWDYLRQSPHNSQSWAWQRGPAQRAPAQHARCVHTSTGAERRTEVQTAHPELRESPRCTAHTELRESPRSSAPTSPPSDAECDASGAWSAWEQLMGMYTDRILRTSNVHAVSP
jgi:hypothetical protein